MALTSIEICAGAGGQALGLEQAGFEHVSLVELDAAACQTLRINRSHWHVTEGDLRHYSAKKWKGVELLAGGVPCPPFSRAGKQLGSEDERNLFPEAIRLVSECRPHAVMLENVRGLLDSVFDGYRAKIISDLKKLGYIAEWRLLNASDFGVPQLRPRVVFVALKKGIAEYFHWPPAQASPAPTVGEALFDLMAANGWPGARQWRERACDIAPTLVGGSKKHGGPDLGPTRAKKAWASIGVDGMGIADVAPEKDFIGMPRLTIRMTARIQGFPDDWQFSGKKTAAYRQVGNAFPPPVAHAVGMQIQAALNAAAKLKLKRAY
ncbi:MAG TPA: DNA cytosine methyltransferase [Candidatus Competibacteraceae bacterium]|nr:DNA cytosine methyltransferase [Candidatus Competibacteraceae bacterium]MCP5132434.1 DNA cytosine methyltransferase [Gammaproteobacteria bacterium]HRY19557.1 DNA cytosine methyltransferase [Candidatus Competibacteraceae bacterium]